MYLLRNRIIYLVSLILIGVILLYYGRDIRIESSRWLSEEYPYSKLNKFRYDEFLKGDPLFVAFTLDDSFFREKVLENLTLLSQSIHKIDNVLSVQTALESPTIIQKNNQIHSLTFREALDDGILTSLKEYKEYFLLSKYHGKLLSKDNKVFLMIVYLDIQFSDISSKNKLRQDVISKTKSIIEEQSFFKNYRLAGDSFIVTLLNENTYKDLVLLLPIVIIFIFIMLFIIFGNIFLTISISITSVLCTLSAFMVLSLLNIPLTSLGNTLLILIVVISVTDSIYILTRWQELTFNGETEVLKKTLKQTWFPCFFTSFTTSIGFSSFLLSDIVSLNYLGLSSLLTIIISYFIIMITNISFLYCFSSATFLRKKSPYLESKKIGHFIQRLYLFSLRYRRFILSFAILIPIIFAILLPFFKVDTNFLNIFFSSNSPIKKDFLFIDQNLGGTGNFDILFLHPDENHFRDISYITKFQKLLKKLDTFKNITFMESYLDPIYMLHTELQRSNTGTSNQARSILTTDYPQSQEELDQELLLLEFSRTEEKKDALSSYMNFTYQNTRIALSTPNLSSNDSVELEKNIKNVIKTMNFNDQLQIEILGSNAYSNTLTRLILYTQFISIAFILFIITISFILSFGFFLGFLGVFVNLLPILFAAIIMIIFGFPFDYSTVLINSIVFGICVDDTIHCLHYYDLHKNIQSIPIRIQHMLKSLGAPLFYTSLLFSASFLILSFASVAVIFKFGLFCVLAIIFAFFSNVIILPLLIEEFSKKNKPYKISKVVK